MFHLHSWKKVCHDKAHYRVNFWPAGFYLVLKGLIQKCMRCPKLRFVPDTPGLRPVEVTIE